MSKTIQYSAGRLGDPQDNDPRFNVVDDAIETARRASEIDNVNFPSEEVRAVWRDDTGEILCLVHQGIMYYPRWNI